MIVQEVDRRLRDFDEVAIIGDIRQAVAERHELQAFDIVLLQPGTIPKTSSGKVRRSTCRNEYECGGLKRWKGRQQIPQQPI